jgi:hypothetical protein
MVNQRNNNSAVCRAKPNGLQSLFSEIDKCTSSEELTRNNQFVSSTLNLKQDISALQANITDSLMTGDSMFGSMGNGTITKQVDMRNEDLKKKKDALSATIRKNEAIIERSSRDFSDVKDTVPEPQKKRILHVLEDYTLALLVFSYLFMSLSVVYLYTILNGATIAALLTALGGSALVTAFLFMVLFFMV